MSFIGCAKWNAILWNVIFGISGLFILIAGVWVKLNYRNHVEFLSGDVFSTPALVILVGSLLTFICFLGCCGSLKESRCMILTFICLAFILFLCEISLAVILIQEHVFLNKTIENQFNYTFTHFNERKEFRDAFYLVQSELRCCGINGPEDWEELFDNDTLPNSCCVVLNEFYECTMTHAFEEGCLDKLIEFVDACIRVLIISVFFVAAVQISTICFARCLYNSLRRNYQTV